MEKQADNLLGVIAKKEAKSVSKTRAQMKQAKAERNFQAVLRATRMQSTRQMRRSQLESTRQTQVEASELAQKKSKESRIAELRGLISMLRSRLIASGYHDSGAAAQLSMAQTELFWLMFGL